jgi:hypothetical protein
VKSFLCAGALKCSFRLKFSKQLPSRVYARWHFSILNGKFICINACSAILEIWTVNYGLRNTKYQPFPAQPFTRRGAGGGYNTQCGRAQAG